MVDEAKRGLDIILAAGGGGGVTVSEASEHGGFSKPTVRRWMNAAVEEGYAERRSRGRRKSTGGPIPYVYTALEEPNEPGDVTDEGCGCCGAGAERTTTGIEVRGNGSGASPHRVVFCRSCGNETATDMAYEGVDSAVSRGADGRFEA